MFGQRIEIFRLFGFPVRVDLSWVFILALITWSLATGVFPYYYEGLAPATYWVMGFAGAIGLFVAITLHEFSHSIVARRFGMPMKGITLFIFGGVAEMEDEPPSPRAEFLMAIAGPIASVVIGFICYALAAAGQSAGMPIPLVGVLEYLGLLNFILVAFNLVPAFPLDGGRVLRAALWHFKGNMRAATRVSSRIGTGFGVLLMFFGALNFFGGSFIGGLWWFLIGMFVVNAAQSSYQRLLLRQALEGEGVASLMNSSPISVPPDATVKDLVDKYVYTHHHKMFPVVENGRLLGCVTTRDIREAPRQEWDSRHVRDIVNDCSDENTIDVDADAATAFFRMSKTGGSRLIVVDHDHLAGVIALKDLMKFLSLKMELEGGEDEREIRRISSTVGAGYRDD